MKWTAFGEGTTTLFRRINWPGCQTDRSFHLVPINTKVKTVLGYSFISPYGITVCKGTCLTVICSISLFLFERFFILTFVQISFKYSTCIIKQHMHTILRVYQSILHSICWLIIHIEYLKDVCMRWQNIRFVFDWERWKFVTSAGFCFTSMC
jgi:hypothetical protein